MHSGAKGSGASVSCGYIGNAPVDPEHGPAARPLLAWWRDQAGGRWGQGEYWGQSVGGLTRPSEATALLPHRAPPLPSPRKVRLCTVSPADPPPPQPRSPHPATGSVCFINPPLAPRLHSLHPKTQPKQVQYIRFSVCVRLPSPRPRPPNPRARPPFSCAYVSYPLPPHPSALPIRPSPHRRKLVHGGGAQSCWQCRA